MVEDVINVETPKSPHDVYSRNLTRRLDQFLKLKQVCLNYLESEDPEKIQRGLKHMEKLAAQQLHFYYPRYFQEKIIFVIKEMHDFLGKLIEGKEENNAIKMPFFMKYHLNKAYKRDINYITRALDVMEHLEKTSLPKIAEKQYELMQQIKTKQSSFVELYPVVAEYKRLFDQEKYEVEHIKSHLHELQILSEAEEKDLKKFLSHLAHHCKHDHGHHHERELEEKKEFQNIVFLHADYQMYLSWL